ncbi:MAG: glycosyltransferase [Myxococcales bacterium]|nr:glycosyltransferase [Myxococcales bacterium]
MGGAERHLANLLAPLKQLGVDNHVALLWGGDAYGDSVAPFAEVHDFGLVPRQVLPSLRGLTKLARNADLVHTQLPWADIAGRAAAVAARRPSVTTLQTTWYDESNVRSFPPAVRHRIDFVRHLDALTARVTRRFFAVSAATKRTYVRELHVPADRIEVISNSVDLAKFDSAAVGERTAARAAFGIPAGEVAIMMVARLVPPKGHADAIVAAAALRDELPLRLYIAGTGPDEQALKQLAGAKGAPVTFLGACLDVPKLLRAADLFLFPSIVEGMPLALIEAMAMGVACLVSDIPENREAGGDAVLYSPPGDVHKLTLALREIARDQGQRDLLARHSRERATRFSSRTVAATVLRSMEDVLARERSRGHVVAV